MNEEGPGVNVGYLCFILQAVTVFKYGSDLAQFASLEWKKYWRSK